MVKFVTLWILGIEMVTELKQNFERLIALYETERQRSETLRAELERAKAAEESYGQQITELKREIENLRLAGAFSGSPEGTTLAKERIARLIREIDKCISFLEK